MTTSTGLNVLAGEAAGAGIGAANAATGLGYTAAEMAALSSPAAQAAAASEAALSAGGAAAKGAGMLSSAWNALGPYGKAAAIQVGGGMIGSAMQAKGQQQMVNDERARYNRNIGTRLWS
jgi:hypothetical protein